LQNLNKQVLSTLLPTPQAKKISSDYSFFSFQWMIVIVE
jgi:hypothetical protein